MSVPSKSIDKNKRYAGVKTNDFVNKARTTETSRAVARTQGWANLGKINSRRIPPPANLPSLKSETGAHVASFDSTIPTGTSHGWTASGNQTPTNLATNQIRPLTPSKQPTQQQLDSLPAHVSIPSPSSSAITSDTDKSRGPATWSTITAGNNTTNSNDQPPNLLGLNDFPRLATQDNKNTKTQSDSFVNSISSTTQGPSFRPANLASWKEGGGRAQTMSNESNKDSNENNNISMQSQMLPTNANTNLHQSQMQNPNNSSFMRMYQQPPPPQQQQQQSSQMWSYNVGNSYGPYGTNQAPSQMSMHHLHHSQRSSSYGNNNQSQQRHNTSTDYKTPTILRNKDIDDLSKLTDNVTWASASQEVNYEEKIRFSDEEDNDIVDVKKSRRYNNNINSQQQSKQSYPQVSQNNNRLLNTNYSQQQKSTCSRVLQDDEHVKQMQDDKNSELMNTLNVAKQRRDEQERNLRDTISQRTTASSNAQNTFDDQKQIPGYQTRPLLTSTGQDNISSSQIDSKSLWGQTNSGTTSTTRTRHDTADSQTFAMKSWSDQMDSFNYASLHEKSGVQVDTDDHHDDTTAAIANVSSTSHKYSRSQSGSSSLSQDDNATTTNRSKTYLITNRKNQKSNLISSKPSNSNTSAKPKTTDVTDYFDNNEQHMKSNDKWGDWDDSNYTTATTHTRYQQSYSNDRRSHQQNYSEDVAQKSSRFHEQTNDYNRNKQSSKTRSNAASRSSDVSASTAKPEAKTVTNKAQPVWRPLSPTRPLDPNDPTPQEAIAYKPQAKLTETNDRRHSAPMDRKQRYATTTTPINTSSIPPLMSVRSDVPPASISTTVVSTTSSKHFKSSNQSQRQEYTNSSHYSQRNDFYNEGNDSGWGNDDEYYEDETGYYDSNMQSHQRHQTMGYNSNVHHRGYIALGSYGRYRRGSTLRHQQQYTTYAANNASGTSSQLNTSAGSKTKKSTTNRTTAPPPVTIITNKSVNESTEQTKPAAVEPVKVVPVEPVKKPSAWTTTDKKTPVIEEKPNAKTTEIPIVPAEVEKPKESVIVVPEMKTANESNTVGQLETESSVNNKKTPAKITASSQKKTNKDPRYQNQQIPHHRNTYTRSMQDYETAQMTSQNYYGATRRTARGGRTARMNNVSTGYYYEHAQQHYNNRYNYMNEHYKQQNQSHSASKSTKRASSTSQQIPDHQQNKQQSTKGSNTNINLRHQSASDNEQKEGEEWETASESSANVRTGHSDTNLQQAAKSTTNETKSINRDRTPPKKSFASQRPLNTRHNETGVHRRGHNIYERGSKTARAIVHRTSRLTTNVKPTTLTKSDGEASTVKQTSAAKKDQHRHSLDGYDLNNVAGVVKIETLPASALEEENEAVDDGGEEFCLVMSKRGRKEQKAAQLSKQNAIESTTNNVNIIIESTAKIIVTNNDEQQSNEKASSDTNQTSTTRTRSGKSVPPRFNGKPSTSATRQHNPKNDHQNTSMYYYDQGYYYYDQSQYYEHDNSYYSYGNYNQSHRQTSARRKPRNQQHHETHSIDDQVHEKKNEPIITEKTHPTSSNVMSNIQMWDPHTESTITNTSKLIEKPSHDRKFGNGVVTSSSNDSSLPLHHPRTAADLSTHSSVSKTNETIIRTIKPPITDSKSHRDNKGKSTTYEKNDAISSLTSNQLFEKSPFLDYDDKQSIGTVGDDYNQKINSLKTIWDASENPSVQLEQTINTMVAMKQKQDTNVPTNNSVKSDNYVQESKPTSSNTISVANTNVSSTSNDDTNNKNVTASVNLQSAGSSTTINQPPTYSTSAVPNKNEQKNICTVKPTQQVAPNIQDQVDVTSYPTFAAPPLPPQMSQASLQQQHILPQSQVNQIHQQHSYPFYESILSAPPPPMPQQQAQQQQQFSRYPPQNFPYRNANLYMQPPPNVPNTNSMYHHTSQGSMNAPPQNNAMPTPMASYAPPYLVDHGPHMISQPQPPPPPPQAYMNNQMMPGRSQAGPYYRTPPPPQQLQTQPAPHYGTQDPLSHGGFYSPFFQPPNSNAPPVGHPSPHNLYGQNEGFHPAHPQHQQMFHRAGSMDRNDHQLMPQPPPQTLSRPPNYPSASSNQPQQGHPPPLLSQNFKPVHTNQQPASSSNQQAYYARPNQYPRPPMPIGAMNTTNNMQQTQPVRSLMGDIPKNLPNNGNNLNNIQPLLQNRQPLITSQSNNNRPSYQHHTPYSNYSKSAGPNDDNVKPKHI